MESPKLTKDIVAKDLNGETIILNLKTGIYFGLNETGSTVFNLLKQGRAQSDIISALMTEFEVDKERAGKDLSALFQEFKKHGIIN